MTEETRVVVEVYKVVRMVLVSAFLCTGYISMYIDLGDSGLGVIVNMACLLFAFLALFMTIMIKVCKMKDEE